MAIIYCVKLANDQRVGLSDGEYCTTLEDACELARGRQKMYKLSQVVIQKVERDDSKTPRDDSIFTVVNPDIYGKNI